MLVPPDNFGLVEEGIYRCAKLDPLNFAFLETLNLKSLVLLDAEKPPRALLNFFEDKSTSLYHIGRSGLKVIENLEDPEAVSAQNNPHDLPGVAPSSMSGYEKMEDWMIISPNLIVEIFEIIFNKSKHNVMIVDKTETVIGLLRKLQKWSFSSIISEYRLYAATRSTYTTETFLELLRMELVPYEENELNKKKEEEEIRMSSYKKEGIKINAHRNSFSARSSISSLSRSIEEFRMDESDLDDFNFEQLHQDTLSLSASPQIPHELLKLAKQRKLKKHNSRDDSLEELKRNNSEELLNSKNHNYYAYYKSYDTQFDNLTNHGKKKGKIKIVLPQEKYLPNWFISQRTAWDELYKSKNV